MVFEYALLELKRLNIDVVLQMNSTDFDHTWSNKWKQWQRFYALAFYAAKTDTVTLAVLKFGKHPSVAEKEKISAWLKARVGAKKLRLITE
jgi:hypothetical protein